MTTLEKVRLFERYLELTRGSSDTTLDVVLDKLLARKRSELGRHLDTLRSELDTFENRYSMDSREFYAKFEEGELGDAMDFLEWSATWQMYNDVIKYLQALSAKPVAA
jgi:hypothetical protein